MVVLVNQNEGAASLIDDNESRIREFNKGRARVTDYISVRPGSRHQIYVEHDQEPTGKILLNFNGEQCVLDNDARQNLIRLMQLKSERAGLHQNQNAGTVLDNQDEIDKPSYEQVLELKYKYETELYKKPKLACSGVFFRKDDKRILQLALFLAECKVPYSEKKYKDYLQKRSIPYKYLVAINKNLSENYEQKQP